MILIAFVMRKLAIALLLLSYVFNLPVFCQEGNSALKNINHKLQSFYAGNAIEKVYLHFDKPYYIAGDTMYFKAYVTFGERHELSRQSGVLHVELINPQNGIYRSVKLQLVDGLGWGDMALPASLPKGNYRIRAYTKLMVNEIGTCFFEQHIPIGSTNSTTVVNGTARDLKQPDIQFFPEGGQLIDGVQSEVAFKAIGPDGMGIGVKGVVTDNTGKVVVSFASSHLGMGAFALAPEEGKIYKAAVVFKDGTQNTVELPVASTNSIVLAIDNSDPKILTIGIRTDNDCFAQNKGKFLNLVINSGVSVLSAPVKLTSPLLAVDFPKDRFGTGVVQFTLFSQGGEPLSERLVFIERPDMIKLKIASDKPAYHSREKTSFTINATNGSDSTVAGHFSVSVIDESKVPVDENKENTILTWLLLSSDLRGYVEQPNYYFTNINSDSQSNLDILMLTQGYRRFVWKQLLTDGYEQPSAKSESGLEIRGLVTNLQGKPVRNAKVNLLNVEGGPMLTRTIDTSGRFEFANLSFADSTRFILRAASEKERNKTRIKYLTDTPAPVINYQLTQPGVDSLMGIALQYHKMQQEQENEYTGINDKALKEVKIKATRKRDPLEPVRIAGTADQLIMGNDLICHGKLADCLEGKLLGVFFRTSFLGTGPRLPYLTTPITLGIVNGNITGNPPMTIMVDGIKIDSDEGLDDIDIEDVEKVEVFKDGSTSIFGPNGGAGVLYITTYKGTGSVTGGMALGILPINAHGFYVAREFYSPKYENGATNARPDLRSTIFWRPELVTDKQGNASFNYYNADGHGTYRVVIEGIDEKGNIGRQVYRYKVE
jgi:hypothetical protein